MWRVRDRMIVYGADSWLAPAIIGVIDVAVTQLFTTKRYKPLIRSEQQSKSSPRQHHN